MSLTAVNPLKRIIQADGPEGEIFRFGLTWLAGGQTAKLAGEVDEACKGTEAHASVRMEWLVAGASLTPIDTWRIECKHCVDACGPRNVGADRARYCASPRTKPSTDCSAPWGAHWLYGRRNSLLNPAGESVAEIAEVLPPTGTRIV